MSIIFLLLSVLSFAAAIVIKILFVPASEGIDITGAHVFFTVKLPIQDLPITESQVNSWCVMLGILFLCLFLTSGLKTRNVSVRQLLAEWIVEKTTNLVKTNMGEFFEGFAPFVAAVLGLSAFSSLSSLIGLFPPTSDINITAGWAILVFFLITYYKMKAGPWIYLKSFGQPVPLLAPLNIISEFATPVSMAFRHYGNVLSGSIISLLVAVGLWSACGFPVSEDRYPCCAVTLFRPFQRRTSGIYLCDADDVIHFRRFPCRRICGEEKEA